MRIEIKPRDRQSGAILLEAMIGILIFALGVLGIVGLQAASLRTTTDSGLRAEAVFAANQLIGDMWADAQSTLVANYSSAAAGASYTTWASQLKTAQGGAWIQDPVVDFGAVATANCNASPSVSNGIPTASVFVQVFWKAQDPAQLSCGLAGASCYTTCGLIGQNTP